MKLIKNILIPVCFAFIFYVGDFSLVYAAGETATDISKEIQELLQAFLSFLSWWWVIFATIAGKLMTNDFVYGNGFHLSNFMRRVWTMMRQFANFAIGILFLYHIFKVIFSGGAVSELKDILVKIVKATILINISWFGIASMIDMSIVGVAAVGSMPAQVLNTQRDGLKQKYYVPGKYIVKRDGNQKYGYDFWTGWNIKELSLNDILPQADTVTGPLFFLGVSVFQLFDKIYVPEQITSWTTMTLNTFLYLFIVLLYTIPLIILAVTNMMRIFRLWIWIMLSPIVALDWSFWLKIWDSAGDKGKKLFDPYELIALIFQPVITVAALWFALVLIIGINDIVQGGTKQGLAELSSLLQFDVSDTNAGVFDNGMTFVKIAWANFGSIGLHLLLAILASILLWAIVKLSFSFSSIVAGASEELYKFGEWALGAIPLPGTGWIGVWNYKRYQEEKFSAQKAQLLDNIAYKNENDPFQKLVNDVRKAAWLKPVLNWFSEVESNRMTSGLKLNESRPEAWLMHIQNVVRNSKSWNKNLSHIQPHINTWLWYNASKTWLMSKPQLWINATMLQQPNSLYNHMPFVRFIDSILSWNDIAAALKSAWDKSNKKIDITTVEYGK
jgi:hypothetical protein